MKKLSRIDKWAPKSGHKPMKPKKPIPDVRKQLADGVNDSMGRMVDELFGRDDRRRQK